MSLSATQIRALLNAIDGGAGDERSRRNFGNIRKLLAEVVGPMASPAGVSNRVPYYDSTGLLTNGSGLTFDSATGTLTVGGPVLLPAGSVTAPALAWADDADGSGTGLYRNAANNVAIASNGRRVLRIGDGDTNAVLEIGIVSGEAGFAAVDFHAGATAIDYDARIACDAGTGTIGAGTLKAYAGSHQFFEVADELLRLDGSQALAVAGTVAAPAWSFIADPDTGFYRPGANQLGFAANGKAVMTIAGGGVNTVFELGLVDGTSAGVTAVDFHCGATVVDYDARIQCDTPAGTTAGGRLLLNAGVIQFNEASSEVARIDGAAFRVIDGSAGTPSITFQSDTNCGLYRIGADILGIAAAGAEVARFSAAGLQATALIVTGTPTLTQTYSTADATHANHTSADLTDSTGGTPGTTLAAIAAAGVYADDDAAIRDALASLADQHNKLRADLTDLKQFVNSIADRLQAVGLAG